MEFNLKSDTLNVKSAGRLAIAGRSLILLYDENHVLPFKNQKKQTQKKTKETSENKADQGALLQGRRVL